VSQIRVRREGDDKIEYLDTMAEAVTWATRIAEDRYADAHQVELSIRRELVSDVRYAGRRQLWSATVYALWETYESVPEVCVCPVLDVSTPANREATARGFSPLCRVHRRRGEETSG
jgi:hypothetical protein